MYVLVPPFRRPPCRAAGPSTTAAPVRSSAAFNAAAVPSHTKHRSPHGGLAAGARSVNDAFCQSDGRWKLIIWSPTYTDTAFAVSLMSHPRRR